jgi:acetyl esterase/lipase
MKTKVIAVTFAFLAWSTIASAQGLPNVRTIPTPEEPKAIALYPGVAPGSESAKEIEIWGTFGPSGRIVRNVTRPTLTPYIPPAGKATGAAMIVAPGGAFQMLSIDSEGHQVAQWLAERGVAAFVLKYRLNPTAAEPSEFLKELGQTLRSVNAPGAQKPSTPANALADAKTAISLVRSRSAEWGIDPARVGFMGFSAGAMTTLSVGLLADGAVRPNFIAPIYPPMGGQTVPADAPPMFVAIAADDQLFGGGQFALVQDWLAAKRPAELHVFERGGHGFGMRPQNTTSDHWIDELFWWLQARGYLGAKPK